MSIPATIRTAAATTAAILLVAARAHAGGLTVSANGVDSGTCGPDIPCATIAQAVTNAVDGDTIVVLPGTHAGTTINKSLSLYSAAGTGGAVITGTMAVTANGVSIGKLGKGFSFEDPTANLTIAADEVTVRGNLFSGATAACLEVTSGAASVIRDNGFDGCVVGVSVLGATATEIRGNQFGHTNSAAVSLGSTSSGAIVRENRTHGPSGSGFVIAGADHLFFRNLVHGTPGGGFTTTGTPSNCELKENLITSSGSPGINISTGSGWVLNKNAVVNNNAPGIYITAGTTTVLNGNLAIGNQSYGILISGGIDHVLTNNSAIDNGGDGLLLAPAGPLTVTGGNLYGNGGSNCGLDNSSGNAITTSGIYWGASTGPGMDPADGLCGNTGAIVVNDPLAAPAKMKMPGIK
jgi:hypothetical protein